MARNINPVFLKLANLEIKLIGFINFLKLLSLGMFNINFYFQYTWRVYYIPVGIGILIMHLQY